MGENGGVSVKPMGVGAVGRLCVQNNGRTKRLVLGFFFLFKLYSMFIETQKAWFDLVIACHAGAERWQNYLLFYISIHISSGSSNIRIVNKKYNLENVPAPDLFGCT